jgi:predicted nicotinamide N-methyase
MTVLRRDILDEVPPDVDVILAGDCCYEAGFAGRVMDWLRRARDAGIDVLVGDPGRRYLPTDELVQLAVYDVRTTTELEDLEQTEGRVYALRRAGG